MYQTFSSLRLPILQIGDRVAVATQFGSGPIVESAIIGIYAPEGAVPALTWERLIDRSIVVDLANGHWAYGCQLRPIHTAAAGSEAQS
jgi:hypothetical protein